MSYQATCSLLQFSSWQDNLWCCHWRLPYRWWILNMMEVTFLPVSSNLKCEVVWICVDEITGNLPALSSKYGAGDDETKDGEKICPEDDPFLLSKVNIGLNVHLTVKLAWSFFLRTLGLVEGSKRLIVLHNMISYRTSNKIEWFTKFLFKEREPSILIDEIIMSKKVITVSIFLG